MSSPFPISPPPVRLPTFSRTLPGTIRPDQMTGDERNEIFLGSLAEDSIDGGAGFDIVPPPQGSLRHPRRLI